MAAQSKNEVTFTRTYRTPLVWVATVVTFPIGLSFFFAGKRQDIVTVLMDKTPGGTSISVSGSAKPRVIEGVRYRLLEDLSLDDEPATT